LLSAAFVGLVVSGFQKDPFQMLIAAQARLMLVVATALMLALCEAAMAAPPTPVNEKMFVPIGGIEQWVTIKGADRSNPVVLVLHGGPGNAWSPFADSLFAGWERDVTLVQWDQRGAGRTYGKSGPSVEPTMTIERMAQDGIEVAEYLTKRLGKKKIVILGASWGSILGIYMAHARPDLFEAYVGMGQMVGWRQNLAASYARVLDLARAAGDAQAVTVLTTLGPPPWDTLRKWPTFRKVRLAYQAKIATARAVPLALNPEYSSPEELAQYEAADDFSFVHFVGMTMSGPLSSVDLPALGLEFKIPIFIVQGEADLTTTPELAKTYVDSLKAPRKQFHLVPGAGHEPSVPTMALVRKALVEEAPPPEPKPN
jgi:pimeloyl-ACP methyl ester carboxylesterase